MKKIEILKKELHKTMDIFMEEDFYIETRILNTNRGTISGYFNDMEKLYSEIKQYDGKYNIFFTLNKPEDGIEARSVNQLKKYAKNTTTDAEIAHRRWVLVDLDPVRPSGISSTDEELRQAEEISDKIQAYLSNSGFPEPVTALSGNGYHLLYSIDMPNDKESTQLIKEFLKALDHRFSTEKVKIDISNSNAARITKMYGTMACKGDSTEERPHRRSKIISVPKNITYVSASLIECVAQENQSEKQKLRNQKVIGSGVSAEVKSNEGFSLDKWLRKHGIKVARTKAVEKGMLYVLEECPWNQEHSRDNGAFIIRYDNGSIVAGCHHDSCKEQGVNWEILWKMKEGNAPLPNFISGKKPEGKNSQKESQADILLEMLEEQGHEFFKNATGEAFVHVPENGSSVNYSLSSESYRMLIVGIYYKATKKSIRKDSVKQVLDTLTAKATIDGNVCETFKRFALYEGKLYYLLADSSNTVLCISENGIERCQEPPVRLIKRKSMLEQPMPLEGKDFADMMQKYYCFASREDEILHSVILVTRLATSIEQPIVIYTGPKGSFKTSSMEMDKKILDYSSVNISMLPKNEEDFLLALNSQDILCFDNIDNITKAQADILCLVLNHESRAVKRMKYTDTELCEINLKATIYMTGINLLSGRTDFLSRCIFINTKVPDIKNGRKSKSYIMEEFSKDKPYILYGVLEIFSKALKVYAGLGDMKLDDRMLDFLKWGYAVSEAIGYGGDEFLEAYKKNRKGIDEEALADDEVANAVMLYLEIYDSFSGSMTELSKELADIVPDGKYSAGSKIKNPIQLSRRLGELSSGLDAVGIQVEIGKKSGKRFVKIHKKTLEGQRKTIKRAGKKRKKIEKD